MNTPIHTSPAISTGGVLGLDAFLFEEGEHEVVAEDALFVGLADLGTVDSGELAPQAAAAGVAAVDDAKKRCQARMALS